MTVSAAQLREYVGDQFISEDALNRILSAAHDTVKAYAGKYWKDVPEDTQDMAVLECGSKLHARRAAPNGSFDDGTGTPVFAPRDPLVTVYPLLERYVIAI